MSGKRLRPRKPLKLTEIIEELGKADDDTHLPSFIAIFPPDNANADITDEDSGDENIVNLHNLPGSQLRAEAEVIYSESSSDEEDNTPLSHLAKRRCSEQVTQETNFTDLLAAEKSTTPKNQKYTWRNRHCPKEYPQWTYDQAPKYLQSPMYYYEALMNNEVIDLLVKYTNIYAQQKNKPGNITNAEMKCFLGILLFSGYVVVPRKTMYWESQKSYIRGKKWYFPLICHSLDMATHNAWQLYRQNGGEYDHLTFRRVVGRALLETYKKNDKRGPCPTPTTHRETSRFDRLDHIVQYKDVQLTCKICKKKTNFMCKKCVIYLHPKTCFLAYHTAV